MLSQTCQTVSNLVPKGNFTLHDRVLQVELDGEMCKNSTIQVGEHLVLSYDIKLGFLVIYSSQSNQILHNFT